MASLTAARPAPTVAVATGAGVSAKAANRATFQAVAPAAKGLSALKARNGNALSISRSSVRASRASVQISAAFAPPTVSDTKAKFLEAYPMPIPQIYSVILQELLVLKHFNVYSKKFSYDPIYALGVISVIDQVMDGYDEAKAAEIIEAMMTSVGQDYATYKADAAKMEEVASSLSAADLVAGEGNAVQSAIAAAKANQEADSFLYNRFFAVGLFRLLELAGATDPTALEGLVSTVGLNKSKVTSDLGVYKGLLSKLQGAKEMQKEYIERERKQREAREAEKAAKAEASA